MHVKPASRKVPRMLPGDDRDLIHRSRLLAEPDRMMVREVLLRGASLDRLAVRSGIQVDWLREHLVRTVRRMSSSAFLRAGRVLAYLPTTDTRLARLRWCHGYRCSELCQVLGLAPREARLRLRDVRNRLVGIERVIGATSSEPGDA